VLRSTRPSLVLERCQDARRQRGWAAALDQLDQRVQIDAALAREVLGEFGVEAGLSQSCATPGDDVGRSSRPGLFSGSKVHVSLARRREPFLHPNCLFGPDPHVVDLPRTRVDGEIKIWGVASGDRGAPAPARRRSHKGYSLGRLGQLPDEASCCFEQWPRWTPFR
jgi:hypothetical protein